MSDELSLFPVTTESGKKNPSSDSWSVFRHKTRFLSPCKCKRPVNAKKESESPPAP